LQLRRALILFAVVLGLAALAASVSQPRGGEERPEPPPSSTRAPEAGPRPEGPETSRLRFSQRGKPATRELLAGRSAVVTVEVSGPGQVELEGLGLTATAEPLTPARFDVLAGEPGRHEVRFTPAGRNESEVVGVLRVRPAT
jgi:glycine cleavage system aminomethyltransferase T